MRLHKQAWNAEKVRKRAIKWTVWFLIGLATGGAWVFYFTDAPTLLRDLVTGQAHPIAYTTMLILTIIGTARHRPEWIPASVALYITAAYWFSSSTSFANPAVALARSLTSTFSGIRPVDLPGFVLAEVAGAMLAILVAAWMFGQQQAAEPARASRTQ